MASGKLKSLGLNIHEVEQENLATQRVNGGFAKWVKDMADARQYYPDKTKMMALSVWRAVQEIEADAFAQELVGATWATRFETELATLMKKNALPQLKKWQELRNVFQRDQGIDRHSPWWLTDPHLPDEERIAFMHELEKFSKDNTRGR